MTPRQQRFVEEYLIDLNATQAAIRAGYSPRTANREGARLLSNVDIQAAVQRGQQTRSQRTEITADRVLKELALVAYQRANQPYREDGTLKTPSEWDDNTAAIIAGVETFEVFAGQGEERELVGHTKKVKRWDKLKALDMLCRHLGLYKDRDQEANDDLLNRVIEAGLETLARAREGAAARADSTGVHPARPVPDPDQRRDEARPVAGESPPGIVDRSAVAPLFPPGGQVDGGGSSGPPSGPAGA